MSFSDLMSSSKGPGVIGLLLAMVVLGGFIILGTLTLDEQYQGGGKSIESIIAEQETTIAAYRKQLEQGREQMERVAEMERAADSLNSANTIIQIRENELAVHQDLINQTQEEIAAIQQSHVDHKQLYRNTVREAARGTTYPTFTTLDGEELHDVTIRQVNAFGMQVSHRDGGKRIAYDKLPLEMQTHFQFDAEEMAEAARLEALARQADHATTEAALEAARLRAQEQREEQSRAAALQKDQTIRALRSRLQSLESEIESLRRDILIESSKTISRAPQMRQQLSEKEALKTQLESRLRTLQTSR